MTEQVERQICIKFCVKLEHSSTETIRMIQKATVVGNWWLAVHHNNVPTHASHLLQSFVVKYQITQVTQPPPSPLQSPDIVPYDVQLFPKLKSSLKGKRFRPSVRFRKIWQGSWWELRELWEVPRCLHWRGLRHHCPVYNISCIFFNKCLFFHITWLDTFWTGLVYT